LENNINCDTSQFSQDLEEPASLVDNLSIVDNLTIDPLKLRTKISSNEVDWKLMDEKLESHITQESLMEKIQLANSSTEAANIFTRIFTIFLLTYFKDILSDTIQPMNNPTKPKKTKDLLL
jgi:hypothetical protein